MKLLLIVCFFIFMCICWCLFGVACAYVISGELIASASVATFITSILMMAILMTAVFIAFTK